MSRLECKGDLHSRGVKAISIRICPDWNVKFNSLKFSNLSIALEYVQIGM